MGSLEVEAPQSILPDIITKGIYGSRFTDRNPGLYAAGKLTATGDTAELCMRTPKRPDSPPVIRKFRATIRPDAGKPRIFYGKAQDPHLQWAKEMCHGLYSQPSIMARDLVNPPPNTLFRQRLLDKKEDLYSSHQKGPLGKSHDQSHGLPNHLNPNAFTFGIRTEKDGFAGELVNPDKSRVDVEREGEEGRDLYRRTHADYKVGEQHCRSYKEPNYNINDMFGIPTPHDNAGKEVKKTMYWLTETMANKAAPIVSKRVDDFRERTQPQLGKVHDPIKDTLNVGPDHTFGILIKPDEYGAGDLMHMRPPGTYLRGKDRQRGIISAMRQHLKKANYHNFQDLVHAFRHYDKSGTGKINLNELREVCTQFSLPVEADLLEQLMDYCDADRDGQINYTEFSNFLNWKDKLPSGLPRAGASAPAKLERDRETTPGRLHKQIDDNIGGHRTSSSMISAVVGGLSTRDYRKYGVPTIRTDLPAPRIRRVSDRTNYGDESNAYGLTNPSMYSTHGVFEKDFLLPRPKHELQEIFSNIGLQMDGATFERLYDNAANRHPRGHVSVESFRHVLDESQALGFETQPY